MVSYERGTPALECDARALNTLIPEIMTPWKPKKTYARLRAAVRLSDTMYLSMSFKKSTPPQKRQLDILTRESRQ